MSRFGGEAFRAAIGKLSPHLKKASAILAPFFKKPKGPEPEERLAMYVKLVQLRKKLGNNHMPAFADGLMVQEVDIHEGTVVGRNAYPDSGDHGHSGDSRLTAYGDG
jgi:hypothetical protein